MGADLIINKIDQYTHESIFCGRIDLSYESLQGTCPKDGGLWILTKEQLEGIDREIERGIDEIAKSLALLVAYCPNKGNDLDEKLSEHEELMEGIETLHYKKTMINIALQLIEPKEGEQYGWQAEISY